MVSSVMEEDITKLREAGYLAADIAHRVPDAGQIVPTPEPHERVVFLTHFVLWLKTLNVKPKVVKGSQAECGGAMVGKMPNVTWLEGSYVETVKGWQSGWFYITEPRDTNWVAAPEFRSGIPTRLTSWKEKGLSWGSSVELTGLQNCVKNMISKKIKLVNVV